MAILFYTDIVNVPFDCLYVHFPYYYVISMYSIYKCVHVLYAISNFMDHCIVFSNTLSVCLIIMH